MAADSTGTGKKARLVSWRKSLTAASGRKPKRSDRKEKEFLSGMDAWMAARLGGR